MFGTSCHLQRQEYVTTVAIFYLTNVSTTKRSSFLLTKGNHHNLSTTVNMDFLSLKRELVTFESENLCEFKPSS